MELTSFSSNKLINFDQFKIISYIFSSHKEKQYLTTHGVYLTLCDHHYILG